MSRSRRRLFFLAQPRGREGGRGTCKYRPLLELVIGDDYAHDADPPDRVVGAGEEVQIGDSGVTGAPVEVRLDVGGCEARP